MWTKLIVALLAGFIAWMLINHVRHNPQAFSKENLNKSAYTLGLLALMLIAVIAFCVLLLKTS